MSTPQQRRLMIDRAEQELGSVLPPDTRARLVETGYAGFALADTQLPGLLLCEDGEGVAIFAHQDGRALTEMGGWDDSAENWHLTEGAFLVGENGCGDYFLLAPDADGVARKLIFVDHEIGILYEIQPDIEKPLHKIPEAHQRQIDAFGEEDFYAPPQPQKGPWDKPTVQDARPAEPTPQPEQSYRPAFVFALSASGIAAFFTMFIGVFLAYRWRVTDPENSPHYQRQIRFFWRAALGWGVAAALLIASLVLHGTNPDGQAVLVFKLAVVVGFATQIVFTGVSLCHSVVLSWGHVLRRAAA